MWTFGDVGCSFRLVNICVRYFFFFKKNQCAKGDFIQSSIDPWEKFGFGFWDGFLARVFLFFGLGRCFSLPVFPFKSVLGGVPLICISCWQWGSSACLNRCAKEFPLNRSFPSVDKRLGWLFVWDALRCHDQLVVVFLGKDGDTALRGRVPCWLEIRIILWPNVLQVEH